jgi:hypothetical protein
MLYEVLGVFGGYPCHLYEYLYKTASMYHTEGV